MIDDDAPDAELMEACAAAVLQCVVGLGLTAVALLGLAMVLSA